METIRTTNKRGRRAVEGSVHKYVVPDDVHNWIRKHGGSRYITDIVLAIEAATLKAQEQKQKSEEKKEDSHDSSPSVQASDFK